MKGYQVQTEELDGFAKALTSAGTPPGLEPSIARNGNVTTWVENLALTTSQFGTDLLTFQAGKLDFGQAAQYAPPSVIDRYMGGAASKLAADYNTALYGLVENLNSFLGSLIILSEVATAVAGDYRNAADNAVIGAEAVKQALDAAKPAGGA